MITKHIASSKGQTHCEGVVTRISTYPADKIDKLLPSNWEKWDNPPPTPPHNFSAGMHVSETLHVKEV